eukprot:Skav234772  [mRNA]  locus=scaffold2396:280200:289604:+ [translate_table: standard]
MRLPAFLLTMPAAVEGLLASALLHLHQPSVTHVAGNGLCGELRRREERGVVVLHIFIAVTIRQLLVVLHLVGVVGPLAAIHHLHDHAGHVVATVPLKALPQDLCCNVTQVRLVGQGIANELRHLFCSHDRHS